MYTRFVIIHTHDVGEPGRDCAAPAIHTHESRVVSCPEVGESRPPKGAGRFSVKVMTLGFYKRSCQGHDARTSQAINILEVGENILNPLDHRCLTGIGKLHRELSHA